MNVERRIADRGGVLGQIKTSDIARLMELFQVCSSEFQHLTVLVVLTSHCAELSVEVPAVRPNAGVQQEQEVPAHA